MMDMTTIMGAVYGILVWIGITTVLRMAARAGRERRDSRAVRLNIARRVHAEKLAVLLEQTAKGEIETYDAQRAAQRIAERHIQRLRDDKLLRRGL